MSIFVWSSDLLTFVFMNVVILVYYADIGSNIGAYTLASRAMGNPVISVDMDPHNHALLYNSLGKDKK